MNLADWMKKNKISDCKLARLIGTSNPSVWKWRKGFRIPRGEKMNKIFEITGGEVTANDFFCKQTGPDKSMH
jgi:transcriptional regulator with XRE-family HTH domain